jgi:hypothetical protein
MEQCKTPCSKSQFLFQGQCNWFGVKIVHSFQNHLFPPKIQIDSLEKWTFCMMIFDEM